MLPSTVRQVLRPRGSRAIGPRAGLATGACLCVVLLASEAAAQAGLGARGFDTERPDVAPPRPAPSRPVAEGGQQVLPPSLPDTVITDVAVVGDMLVPRAALRAAVLSFAGRRVNAAELEALVEAVSAAHRAADIALFAVIIPQQDFAGGVVVIRVIEGQIDEIAIEGDTEGADLGLTRAYVQALRLERPLRRTTLERYLLLMGDVPGRRVDNRLEPLPTPGRVRLVLTVSRTSLRLGLGVDNLGADFLGRLQVTTGITANALLREGDSTRLTFGFPVQGRRFAYYGLRHQQPIGTEGAYVALSASRLDLNRTRRSVTDGHVSTVGVQLVHPVIRGVEQTLQVFGGLDVLESRTDVPLGLTSDEATRVFRGGAVLALSDATLGTGGSLSLVLSQGVDAAGARQDIDVLYGDPGFTKLNLAAAYQQPVLGGALVLRLRANAQVTGERLPASEQFTYGGVSVGRAFGAATLSGDRGITASATLALPFRTLFDTDAAAAGLGTVPARMVRGGEFYVFADGGRMENLSRLVVPRSDRAASVGFGIGLPVEEETSLNLEVATPALAPRAPGADRGSRFVLVFRRSF